MADGIDTTSSPIWRASAAIALVNMRDIGRDVRLSELTDDELRMIARAVLEAIREPSLEMCDATAWDYQKDDMALVRGTARAIWTDMIDAALAEKTNA